MGEYTDLIQTISLTLGVAWASGINLYAAVTMLGIGGGLVLVPALSWLFSQDPATEAVAVQMAVATSYGCTDTRHRVHA